MGSRDRAGDDMTDAEEIRIRNKMLEKAGATSRYIDSKPTEDFTFGSDEHGTEKGEAPDEVPANLVARANEMEKETLADLAQRGIGIGEHDSCTVSKAPPEPPTVTRARVVTELLSQQRSLGYGYAKYESELADLIAKNWPHHHPIPSCETCDGRTSIHEDEDGRLWLIHVHKDDAKRCEDMIFAQDKAEDELLRTQLGSLGSLVDEA